MPAITDLATAGSVAGTDYLVINQSGTDRKVLASRFGVVALANAFTQTQSFNPTGANNAIYAGMELNNSGEALAVYYNGVRRLIIRQQSNANLIRMDAFDNGSGVGPYIQIERNSSASTPSPGAILIYEADGGVDSLYPDNSGVWRTLSALPTSATFASGTVVGSQSSSLDSKDIQGEPLPAAELLAHIAQAAEAVRRFVYKSDAYNGEEFSGIVVDYAPRYGMDRDEAHPSGKSLNMINAIGDLMIVVNDLAQRVAGLEAQLAGR